MSIITLTTDFGETDPFVGIMKGVILGICPKVKIIDITHNIPPQDIIQASFVLGISFRYFPKKTIHVCVVDPGVGSSRKPILIETSNYFFIGPDNGLFTTIIESENIKQVIELTEKKYWSPELSQTFHGRDIFSPVSAFIARGTPIKALGRQIKIESLTKTNATKIEKITNGYIGIVQHIDRFGNLITNLPNDAYTEKMTGKVNNLGFSGLVSNFSEGKPNNLSAIKGSSGYLELFANKGNAAKLTNASVGDKVEVIFYS